MHWHKWPYWLKGGVVGITVGFLLDIALALRMWGMTLTPLFLNPIDITESVSRYLKLNISSSPFYLILASVALSFLFGVIVGSVVSLIKKKKGSPV